MSNTLQKLKLLLKKMVRKSSVPRYQCMFLVIPVIACVGVIVMLYFSTLTSDGEEIDINSGASIFLSGKTVLIPTDESCLFHTCMDVYRCGRRNDDNRIAVYLYPEIKGLDESRIPIMLPASKEFREIIDTIKNSIYYTSNPNEACIFVPNFDLLNQNSLRLYETGQLLASLQWLV